MPKELFEMKDRGTSLGFVWNERKRGRPLGLFWNERDGALWVCLKWKRGCPLGLFEMKDRGGPLGLFEMKDKRGALWVCLKWKKERAPSGIVWTERYVSMLVQFTFRMRFSSQSYPVRRQAATISMMFLICCWRTSFEILVNHMLWNVSVTNFWKHRKSKNK